MSQMTDKEVLMTDKEVLMLAYGALRSHTSGTFKEVLAVIEDHLFPKPKPSLAEMLTHKGPNIGNPIDGGAKDV